MENMVLGMIGTIGVVTHLMVGIATIIQEVAVLQGIISSMLAKTAQCHFMQRTVAIRDHYMADIQIALI